MNTKQHDRYVYLLVERVVGITIGAYAKEFGISRRQATRDLQVMEREGFVYFTRQEDASPAGYRWVGWLNEPLGDRDDEV